MERKSYRAQTGAGKISVSVQAGPCISDQACRRDNRAEDRTGLYYQPVFKSKDRKWKPVIRNILRCAVYQIKYMDQVPDSAACNEAVNLATRKGFKNLRGFVNGVLRNIARNIDKIAYPENTEEFLSQ